MKLDREGIDKMDKVKKNVISTFVGILSLSFCFVGCNPSSSSNSTSKEGNLNYEQRKKVETNQQREKGSTQVEESIDGTYTDIVTGAGPGGEYTVQIYGSRWSSYLRLNAYDNGTRESGLVKGKDLYEESGFYKVGSVRGKTLTMGRFSATKK
jgi:hypothetical protein